MREEVAAISAMLQDRVDDLAPILLPEGRREGGDWRAGARGARSIRLTGPKRGVYTDFEQSPKGCDMLQAIADLLCGGKLRDAIAWARSYLGLQDASDEAMALARQRAAERRAAQEAKAKQVDAQRIKQAGGLWHSAVPLLDSPADAYLRGRGIDLRALMRLPGAIRYQPRAWCKDRRAEHPAMVSALFKIGAPKLVATHRTYLAQNAAGGWGKADVTAPRSILGSWPGAVVPIQRGEGAARWADIEEGEVVAFGEGIEEGLSIALVQPSWRVGAVGFVGNFAQIALPCWCHVMLCINNDEPGSAAEKAIFGDPERRTPGAVETLEKMGHVVRVLRPPLAFKDWNDLLTGKRRDD